MGTISLFRYFVFSILIFGSLSSYALNYEYCNEIYERDYDERPREYFDCAQVYFYHNTQGDPAKTLESFRDALFFYEKYLINNPKHPQAYSDAVWMTFNVWRRFATLSKDEELVQRAGLRMFAKVQRILDWIPESEKGNHEYYLNSAFSARLYLRYMPELAGAVLKIFAPAVMDQSLVGAKRANALISMGHIHQHRNDISSARYYYRAAMLADPGNLIAKRHYDELGNQNFLEPLIASSIEQYRAGQ